MTTIISILITGAVIGAVLVLAACKLASMADETMEEVLPVTE